MSLQRAADGGSGDSFSPGKRSHFLLPPRPRTGLMSPLYELLTLGFSILPFGFFAFFHNLSSVPHSARCHPSEANVLAHGHTFFQ